LAAAFGAEKEDSAIHMREGHYNFHNKIRIKFITDNQEFFDFVDKNLAFFRTEDKDPADLETKVYFSQTPELYLAKKVAADLFIEEKKVLYFSKLGFKILAQEEQPLLVTAYVWRQPIRDAYNVFFARSFRAAREEKYLTLMRHSLHLPLFYLLQKQGYTLLHGSAVAKDKKAYLFIGANKVGKTTLALNLIYHHGFKFISDDFLAVKDDQLFAFPDRIRATSFTLDSLPPKTGMKMEKSSAYSKFHFDLPREKIEALTFPAKIFFVVTGKKTKIEKIDPNKKVLNLIFAVHNHIHEFPEYSYLAFLPHSPLMVNIQERIANFLENKEFYFFCQDGDIKKNAEIINAQL
jgi:hypothetical protein